MTEPSSSGLLPQPPSAKTARTFGILGICSHLLCLLGAPFAILFGILALVRHGRAKREHAADPGTYAAPFATGLVTGLVALGLLVMTLPMTGIVSAIAIPALLGQRERGRIRAMNVMVERARTEVARAALDQQVQARGGAFSAEAAVRTVLARPEFQYPAARNPYGGEASPYHAGPEPREPGCVALEAVPDYAGAGVTAPCPAVIIRGGIRRTTGPQALITRVVPLQ